MSREAGLLVRTASQRRENSVNNVMNNGTLDTSPAAPSAGSPRTSRSASSVDELSRLKQELLKAEVKLARARATVAGAEVDVKVLTAHLKAFSQ